MSLKGNLETVSLSGVLQLLSEEQKTGVLKVKNSNGEFQIILLNGFIVYAIQYKREARLGEILIQAGLISKKNVEKCLQLAKLQKLAIGKVFVDRGFITKEQLHKYLYIQFEDILFSLFLNREGEFEYSDTHLILRWLIVFEINTIQLIIGALRRVDEVTRDNEVDFENERGGRHD